MFAEAFVNTDLRGSRGEVPFRGVGVDLRTGTSTLASSVIEIEPFPSGETLGRVNHQIKVDNARIDVAAKQASRITEFQGPRRFRNRRFRIRITPKSCGAKGRLGMEKLVDDLGD